MGRASNERHSPHHQRTLADWGTKAEALYTAGDMQALGEWLDALQAQEDTWAAVVTSDVTPVAGERCPHSLRKATAWGG